MNGKTRAGVGGEGVKVKKYTSVIQCCIGEIFSESRIFLVDDDSELPGIGSVR